MYNEDTIQARLLFSLARKRKWGESHTAYENIFKSLKSEAFGKDAMKLATRLAEELMRDGFIIKNQHITVCRFRLIREWRKT